MTKGDNYELFDLIGRSRFTKTCIYLSKQKQTGKLLVVKLTDLDETSSEILEIITKELSTCRALCHENVLIHHTCFTVSSKLYVISDLMKFGSCTDIIESHFVSGMPERVIAFILKSVLKALSYLHNLGLVHRGVKGGHIFVSDKNIVKLGGNRNVISALSFSGKKKTVYDYPKHDTFSLPWLSPEILQQNMEGYHSKSDTYSLGITACELANGYAPFTDMPSTQMLLEKLRGTKPSLLDKSTIPDTSFIDIDDPDKNDDAAKYQIERQSRLFTLHFHDFVLQCLHRQPGHRPSNQKLLQHSFFEQTNDVNLTVLLKPLVPIGATALSSYTRPGMGSNADSTRKIADMNVDDWDFEVPIRT